MQNRFDLISDAIIIDMCRSELKKNNNGIGPIQNVVLSLKKKSKKGMGNLPSAVVNATLNSNHKIPNRHY